MNSAQELKFINSSRTKSLLNPLLTHQQPISSIQQLHRKQRTVTALPVEPGDGDRTPPRCPVVTWSHVVQHRSARPEECLNFGYCVRRGGAPGECAEAVGIRPWFDVDRRDPPNGKRSPMG